MTVEIIYDGFQPSGPADPMIVKKQMARDASWGTFIDTLPAARAACGEGSEERWKKSEPKIANLAEGRWTDQRFALAFPDQNFSLEKEGVDHFVATVAGDILLNPQIKTIEVADFDFSESELYRYFPGPSVGIDGIYKHLLANTIKGEQRPILAYTMKPRLGLSVSDCASLFSGAASGGVDIVEDDERLIDPPHCPFQKRIDAIANLQSSYPTIYSANITGVFEDATKRLDYAVKKGVKIVKFDVLVHGFETLRRLALYIQKQYASEIAITVYPDAYGAYRRLSRSFILKLSRLCGADIIYAGSPNWARYENEGGKLKDSIAPVYNSHLLLSKPMEKAPHVKRSLPTITNDQHLSRSETICAFFRKHYEGHYEYAFFVGGGLSAFPADLTTAVVEWMKCIRFASTQNLERYRAYDLDKFEAGFVKNGWKRLDVIDALQ